MVKNSLGLPAMRSRITKVLIGPAPWALSCIFLLTGVGLHYLGGSYIGRVTLNPIVLILFSFSNILVSAHCAACRNKAGQLVTAVMGLVLAGFALVFLGDALSSR